MMSGENRFSRNLIDITKNAYIVSYIGILKLPKTETNRNFLGFLSLFARTSSGTYGIMVSIDIILFQYFVQ